MSVKVIELPPEGAPVGSFFAFLAALAVTLGLFLLLPITQLIEAAEVDRLQLREVVAVESPPPEAPPPPEEEVVQQELTPPEVPEPSLVELDLQQLELALNPGIGEALSMGVSVGSFAMVDTIGDIKSIFTFEDMDEPPRLLNKPRVNYPRELVKYGIRSGEVLMLIEIDAEGRARVLEILRASQPELIKPAEEVVRTARFSPPVVDGKTVKVRGKWPLKLSAPRK